MKFLILLLTTLPMMSHAQTNYNFQNMVCTDADPSAIWALWTDVPNWNKWDSGLKDATIQGDFTLGARGKLIPDKGPKSKFIISEYREGVGYTFKTRIPFGWLIVKRYITIVNSRTNFTHEVKFTGLFRKPLGNSVGKRYREMLPEVMNKIKTLAEEKSGQL